jgi:predicted dehydrogenase
MKKIRFGILSTAKIGVEKVIPAMQRGQWTTVVAIASRSLDRAQAAAQQLGIPHSHGSYDALLADPDVDAIYNPLPNDLHVSWSIKALQAGKHVLCEKPIALSAAEARHLVEAGRRHPRLKLMEAFMYRHHPQWQKTKELVQTKQIGTLRAIQTIFSFFNDDPANIRHSPLMGGGSLMDIGCYPISLSRWLFDAEPQRVLGLLEYDSRFQVDRLASAILEFGVGQATFTCSMQVAPFQQVNIIGTHGRIELSEVPFNAPNDRPCIIRVQEGDQVRRLEMQVCDQYTIQGDLFAQAILNDTAVPTPIEDAVRNMEVIDAIVASGRNGGWMRPGAM